MLSISDNKIIRVTRGDSFSLDFRDFVVNTLEPDYEKQAIRPGDTLYFGLMEPNKPFEHALIRKVATAEPETDKEGNLIAWKGHFDFSSEMTEFIMPGLYYYSVKIQHENGDVYTFIPKTKFYIID